MSEPAANIQHLMPPTSTIVLPTAWLRRGRFIAAARVQAVAVATGANTNV